MAKLYFKYGAMGCGKTSSLLQAIFNYKMRNLPVLLLKPKIDIKGEKKVVSRIGLEREVDYLIKASDNLYHIIQSMDREIGVIFVDEAQFLTRSQVDDLLRVVYQNHIPVLCYGLRTDFNTNAFEGSLRLLEVAHSIEELKTICRCGKKAIFNARMVNQHFVFEGDQVAIDGKDHVSYDALCPSCYYEEKEKYYNSKKKKI